MDNITDDNFSYDGYQVVRGEFFSHIKEPSITFNNLKFYVNTACLNKLPDVDFVHILINPSEKKLVIRPCSDEEKDSFCWRSGGQKRRPKQITCRIFFAKIMHLMDWNPDYRYKLIGKLIHAGNECLFVFDLKNAETFRRIVNSENGAKKSREASFPEHWKEQFGLPYEEHKKALQVNIVNGYAVFDLKTKQQTTVGSSDNEQITKGDL